MTCIAAGGRRGRLCLVLHVHISRYALPVQLNSTAEGRGGLLRPLTPPTITPRLIRSACKQPILTILLARGVALRRRKWFASGPLPAPMFVYPFFVTWLRCSDLKSNSTVFIANLSVRAVPREGKKKNANESWQNVTILGILKFWNVTFS